MLDENPKTRWDVDQIASCAWLNNYGEPDNSNIFKAIDKVIMYMHS